MKKLVLLVLLAAVFASCRTKKVYMPVETKVLDSIILHDTTFQERLVPYKDSVATPDTASFLCNPYAYSHAKWSNGLLHHSLGIYPFATVTVKVPYFVEKIRRVEVPKHYPVERKLSWWERIKMDIGGYAIGTVIITVLIIFGKLVYKLKKGG